MSRQKLVLYRLFLPALLLAAFINTSLAQTLTLVSTTRQLADSVIAQAPDIGYWIGPDDNTNNAADGDFNLSYTVDTPVSAYLSFHSTAVQQSTITATTNSLHASGRLQVTSAAILSEGGSAVWNIFSDLHLSVYIDQPFLFTLRVTNTAAVADPGTGADAFVRLQDQLGNDLALFGGSTTLGYSGATNPLTGSYSAVLPAGGYDLRAIAGDLDGGESHSANRIASFTFDITPVPPDGVTLKIRPMNAGVVLSWPTTATNYTLQATGVVPGGSWNPVTNAPVQAADEWQVVLQPATGARFFQLAKPLAP